jgi:hypothetical protein
MFILSLSKIIKSVNIKLLFKMLYLHLTFNYLKLFQNFIKLSLNYLLNII